MTDPYIPPAVPVADPGNAAPDHGPRIEALPVSEKWKKRFRLINRAGGPRFPNIQNLPHNERSKVLGFNVLAFLLGPIYYASKGMWRKGLVLLLLCAVLSFVFHTFFSLFGWDQLARAVPYGMGAVFSMRANIDLYKKLVLGDNGWW